MLNLLCVINRTTGAQGVQGVQGVLPAGAPGCAALEASGEIERLHDYFGLLSSLLYQ